MILEIRLNNIFQHIIYEKKQITLKVTKSIDGRMEKMGAYALEKIGGRFVNNNFVIP